jgi:hypothetical protein
MSVRRQRERERRETVQRYHILKDAEEDFALNKAGATSADEQERLTSVFAEFRRRHREEDVRRGKRLPGTHVQTHQIMWARWIEIAAQQTHSAQLALASAMDGQPQLVEELRSSMLAVTAAACTIEALYEDVRYLIPARPDLDSTQATIADCLSAAFGWPQPVSDRASTDIAWIFERRNESLHPYSESSPTAPHPAGFDTGEELSRFNGMESRRALEAALEILAFAERPPAPANRWVQRWANERQPYHLQVVQPIRTALAEDDLQAPPVIQGSRPIV